MDAELKAKELFDKYFNVLPEPYPTVSFKELSKQCAIICCNEIIEVISEIDENVIKRKEEYRLIEEYAFWQSTKEEIQKL